MVTTCRAISLKNNQYYPDYILKGWSANHKLLFCRNFETYDKFLKLFNNLSLELTTHHLESSLLAFNSYINII